MFSMRYKLRMCQYDVDPFLSNLYWYFPMEVETNSISSLHILLRDDMQFKPPPLVPISPAFNWPVLPLYSKSGDDEVNIFLDTRPFIFKLL